MSTIRAYTSYEDALDAVREAGGIIIGTSNDFACPACQSFAPTVYFQLPDNSKVEVVWDGDEGRVWHVA